MALAAAAPAAGAAGSHVTHDADGSLRAAANDDA
jgi:hypothetical protein